jgi:hypothetical protein
VAIMSDLSFLLPLALAVALFVLVVVGIVAVLRISLARSIARSRAIGPMPVVASSEDAAGALRARDSV